MTLGEFSEEVREVPIYQAFKKVPLLEGVRQDGLMGGARDS